MALAVPDGASALPARCHSTIEGEKSSPSAAAAWRAQGHEHHAPHRRVGRHQHRHPLGQLCQGVVVLASQARGAHQQRRRSLARQFHGRQNRAGMREIHDDLPGSLRQLHGVLVGVRTIDACQDDEARVALRQCVDARSDGARSAHEQELDGRGVGVFHGRLLVLGVAGG
ncbi:MAG: hypothetical protein KatS3mg103_0856 [Phycisphaerales bacterium]|nr:MAG: hypothetical protein KatS3mg103_0856 [Phycisphaerales bacterium]